MIPVALDAFPWYMSNIEWERLHALTIISAPSSLASEITAADCLRTVGSSEKIPGAPTLRTLPSQSIGFPPSDCISCSKYSGSFTLSPPHAPSIWK